MLIIILILVILPATQPVRDAARKEKRMREVRAEQYRKAEQKQQKVQEQNNQRELKRQQASAQLEQIEATRQQYLLLLDDLEERMEYVYTSQKRQALLNKQASIENKLLALDLKRTKLWDLAHCA